MSKPTVEAEHRDDTERRRKSGRIYGRRLGHKLKPNQIRLLDELLPVLKATPEYVRSPGIDRAFSQAPKEIWLEIGFGGGEHLIWQAARNPDIGFIGVEPFVNGIVKLLAAIQAQALTNIRVFDGDAREMLDALPDECVTRTFILFPDPWPKTRHHKRRIVNRETLRALHRIMREGAELRIASDIPDFIRWTLLHVLADGGFTWTAHTAADWRHRPEDWPATRYENKAIREGRTPVYLAFRRV